MLFGIQYFKKIKIIFGNLYCQMRQPSLSQKQLLREAFDQSRPFAFIWNGLCWENIILPIFALNDYTLQGKYKVLTNAIKGQYHFVIFDSKNAVIYDPTFEKANDSRLIDGDLCKGVGPAFPLYDK